MGATPISRSRAVSTENADKNKSVIGSLYDLLYVLLRDSLPGFASERFL
jgi:hypothetical protein